MEEIQLYKDKDCTQPVVPLTGMSVWTSDEKDDILPYISLLVNVTDNSLSYIRIEDLGDLFTFLNNIDLQQRIPYIKWQIEDYADTVQNYTGMSPLIYLDQLFVWIFETSFVYIDYNYKASLKHYWFQIDPASEAITMIWDGEKSLLSS